MVIPEPPTCPLFRSAFYFLRHGETDANRLGLVAGTADVALNATGRQQAQAAAALLNGSGIDAVYSSALQRARDTADCAARTLGLRNVVIPELGERDWGEFQGKPRELRVRGATPAGGESLEEFTRRTLTGLARIRGGGLPLIVAHAGTFRVLCSQLGLAAPEAPIENGRPVRFVPSCTGHASWSIEPL